MMYMTRTLLLLSALLVSSPGLAETIVVPDSSTQAGDSDNQPGNTVKDKDISNHKETSTVVPGRVVYYDPNAPSTQKSPDVPAVSSQDGSGATNTGIVIPVTEGVVHR